MPPNSSKRRHLKSIPYRIFDTARHLLRRPICKKIINYLNTVNAGYERSKSNTS